MQSSNQQCNIFQSAVGIFLHSYNMPEAAIDLLVQLRVSVLLKTISHSTSSLSNEAETAIKQLGQTFLAAYAYDNLDIDFKQYFLMPHRFLQESSHSGGFQWNGTGIEENP